MSSIAAIRDLNAIATSSCWNVVLSHRLKKMPLKASLFFATNISAVVIPNVLSASTHLFKAQDIISLCNSKASGAISNIKNRKCSLWNYEKCKSQPILWRYSMVPDKNCAVFIRTSGGIPPVFISVDHVFLFLHTVIFIQTMFFTSIPLWFLFRPWFLKMLHQEC